MAQLDNPDLNYSKAGVDIDKADSLVRSLQGLTGTQSPRVLSGIGGFGALFELPWADYKQPVLVSGTDGVGTKLLLAKQANQYGTIGIDLVAMCVNDIICCGAAPLFFLDYYATGQLDESKALAVISGIKKGCDIAQIPLVGGETAELPGMYAQGDYDLAGFSVGMVEKSQIIDGKQIAPGDVLLALASSGPHANGYSLIRKVLVERGVGLDETLGGQSLGEALLTPTKIYVSTILSLVSKLSIKGIAHITGGGLLENIPRMLPPYVQAVITQQSWEWPEVFGWLQQQGRIAQMDMLRTFNVGVGMVVVVAPNEVALALDLLAGLGEVAWVLGQIETGQEASSKVVMA